MRKRLLNYLCPASAVCLVLLTSLFSHSCANTTQAPSGGAKDTIPPVLVKVNPAPNVLGVPLEGAKFSFTFNEYVTVKDPKRIVVSPPLDKPLKTKLSGKTLSVWFESPLKPDRTYTIDFSDAVADNNEGNKFPGYTYVFSTGSSLDSMMITGSVFDCNDLKPVPNANVLLYTNPADSAVFKEKPFATVRTDEWGFFCLRNIPDTLFRLYAVKEEIENLQYDPETDMIAFLDSLVRPLTVVNDTLQEIQKFDMKDTVNCKSRHSEYELVLFREGNSRQMINNKERIADRVSYISFTSPKAHIDTMWVKGISEDRLITQFNKERDSLEIWVNDRRRMPDTLQLYVNYLKTDSTGNRTPFLEEVKLARNKASDKTDTTCALALTVDPKTVEEDGFSIAFTLPIVRADYGRIKYYSINPKQIEQEAEFTVKRSEEDIKKYTLKPAEKLLQGFDYRVEIPRGVFMDINGYLNDSTAVSVTLPNDDKLSSLSLVFSGVGNNYIVDFLDENKTTLIRQFVISENCTRKIPYLDAGKYTIRITKDVNGNSEVDTGSLLDHIMPEKVRFFTNGEDGEILEIPEMSEVEQLIDMDVLFAD